MQENSLTYIGSLLMVSFAKKPRCEFFCPIYNKTLTYNAEFLCKLKKLNLDTRKLNLGNKFAFAKFRVSDVFRGYINGTLS